MSDDQDTTAPGRVALMYPLGCEKSVLWARPEHYSSVHPSMRQWAPCIARCIWDAALEEMRVRAALKRAGMDENGMVHITTTLVSKPGGDRCGYCGAACDHYD